MRVRPFLVSAACSAVAALALVLSEGAMSGVHMPGHGGGGRPSAPRSGAAPGSTLDQGASSSVAFGDDFAVADPGSPDGQASTDQPGGGQSASSGGIDPGALAQQLLPPPPPLPIGP